MLGIISLEAFFTPTLKFQWRHSFTIQCSANLRLSVLCSCTWPCHPETWLWHAMPQRLLYCFQMVQGLSFTNLHNWKLITLQLCECGENRVWAT